MGSMIGCSGTIGRISDAPPPTPVVCQRAGAALGGGQEVSRRTATIRNNSWCGQALLSSSRMRRVVRRYDWADFGRTSPNPSVLCLSTCAVGSTRPSRSGARSPGCETIGFSQTDFHSPRWRFRCPDRTGHRQGRDDVVSWPHLTISHNISTPKPCRMTGKHGSRGNITRQWCGQALLSSSRDAAGDYAAPPHCDPQQSHFAA